MLENIFVYNIYSAILQDLIFFSRALGDGCILRAFKSPIATKQIAVAYSQHYNYYYGIYFIVACLTHLALSRSDLVWFRAAVWLEAELLVENDVNPAAAAAAALAADAIPTVDVDVVVVVVVVVGDDATDAGKTTPAAEVLLATGPPATTPPDRTCTVTGSGPEVRTAL